MRVVFYDGITDRRQRRPLAHGTHASDTAIVRLQLANYNISSNDETATTAECGTITVLQLKNATIRCSTPNPNFLRFSFLSYDSARDRRTAMSNAVSWWKGQ